MNWLPDWIEQLTKADLLNVANLAALVGIVFLLSLVVSALLLAQPKPRRNGFDLTYKPETGVRLDPLEPANDR